MSILEIGNQNWKIQFRESFAGGNLCGISQVTRVKLTFLMICWGIWYNFPGWMIVVYAK